MGAGGSLQRLRLYWNHIVVQSLMLIPEITQAESQMLREEIRVRERGKHTVVAGLLLNFNIHVDGEKLGTLLIYHYFSHEAISKGNQ